MERVPTIGNPHFKTLVRVNQKQTILIATCAKLVPPDFARAPRVIDTHVNKRSRIRCPRQPITSVNDSFINDFASIGNLNNPREALIASSVPRPRDQATIGARLNISDLKELLSRGQSILVQNQRLTRKNTINTGLRWKNRRIKNALAIGRHTMMRCIRIALMPLVEIPIITVQNGNRDIVQSRMPLHFASNRRS